MKTEGEAADHCFGPGMRHRITCLDAGTRSPKYLNHAARMELEWKIRAIHASKGLGGEQ